MKTCERCDQAVTALTVCNDSSCPYADLLQGEPVVSRGFSTRHTRSTAKVTPSALPDPATSSPDIGARLSHEVTDYAGTCSDCGTGIRPGSRFCGGCGASLTSSAAETSGSSREPDIRVPAEDNSSDLAQVEHVEAPAVAEPDASIQTSAGNVNVDHTRGTIDYDLQPSGDEGGRGRKPLVLAGVALTLLTVGGAALFTLRPSIDQGTPSGNDAAEPVQQATPLVSGSYRGHFQDQDISLAVIEPAGTRLDNLRGIARYSNVVSGDRCSTSVTRAAVGGGEQAGQLRFDQRPTSGEPKCPLDIPMRIAVSPGSINQDGTISALDVQWLDPDSSEVLMRGTLDRE